MAVRNQRHPIKARSHLLHLLGDELIGDERLAVFELVKNSYDADANEVRVLLDINTETESRIVVEDNGYGMSLSDITEKWLEIGTDSRRKPHSRAESKYNRIPLGEKGVGRLAAFKLGNIISLTTRTRSGREVHVEINWNALIDSAEYLKDLAVDINVRDEPLVFIGNQHGTRIEITDLRRPRWTRAEVRSLYRLVTSLSSPFKTPESFAVAFELPGKEKYIGDMLSPEEFLAQSIWKYTFELSPQGNEVDFNWAYQFSPPNWKDVRKVEEKKRGDRLQLVTDKEAAAPARGGDGNLILKPELMDGIGPIKGAIYAYYRRPEVLKVSGNQMQLKSWLNDQSGVRVYRDGVRVFNYGEPSDDWLGLNAKRINAPTGRLGTQSVVAAVELELENSGALREKTNREGFESGPVFDRLQRIVSSVFEHFGHLHSDDRKSLDLVIRGRSPASKEKSVSDAIGSLKERLFKHPEFPAIKHDLEAIEDQFSQVRDVMVGAGIAGLNLAVVFHEVERGVDALHENVKKEDINPAELRAHIEHIQALLHTFAPLLRRNKVKNVFAKDIIQATKDLREHRFRVHKVLVSAPILIGEEPDFRLKVPSNLVVGALGNLIDNSIYWSEYRRARDDRKESSAIRIATAWDETSDTGIIAVVDNGPGFSIPKEKAIEPFITRRPEGMGLGLYFAGLVMDQCGGSLTIHEPDELRDELDIPEPYDGAAVALRFGRSA